MPKGYRRTHYIKDLYHPETFLMKFDTVHFANVSAFLKATNQDYFIPRYNVFVNIHNEIEFKTMKTIIKSGLTGLCNLTLIFKNQDYFHLIDGIEGYKFRVIATPDFSLKESLHLKGVDEFKTNNAIWIPYTITYDNYRTVFDVIMDAFQKNKSRFAWLEFDYVSFHEKMTLKELHELTWRVNLFISWCMVSRNEEGRRKTSPNRLEWNNFGGAFIKKIFIDDELNLYFNERHYNEKEETPALFTLQKDKTGEDIGYQELNRVLHYADLSPLSIVSPSKHMLSITDYYQNYLINKVINEIPYITQFFMELLKWAQ